MFTRDRNEGLDDHPGLKTSDGRVRANSAKADPKVVGVLGDLPWQGHHLIPVQIIKDNLDLFGPASEVAGGFQTDEVGNMTPLPSNAAGQDALREQRISRPVHRGSHPEWNERVREGIQKIRDQLDLEGLTPNNSRYASRAKEMIRELEQKLRQELVKGGKVTEHDVLPTTQDGALHG